MNAHKMVLFATVSFLSIHFGTSQILNFSKISQTRQECNSHLPDDYGTPEGTIPFQLFIRTETVTRKLKLQSKQQISRLNDLLYHLNDTISHLNKSFVVLLSILSCFNF